jgi:hypothetical protein
MKLIRLARGRWDVLVTEQVAEVLSDHSSAKGPKRAMLSLLRESIPMGGPQEGNRTVCVVFTPRSLKLAEFRKGEYRGTKIRVIWFYGDEETRRRVVCVRAFEKNSAQTPPGEIAAATELRTLYFRAVAASQLSIEDLPTTSGDQP